MIAYFGRVASDFKAICKGLAITFRYMWKPNVTVQYPTEKLVPYERFRGALLFDAVTCISCNLCVKACPSDCITLENAKNETGKTIAKVAWYTIDFGKCNFCRLCEEACPTKPKSVWHSLDYELTFSNRPEMVRSWFKKEGVQESELVQKAKAIPVEEGAKTDDPVGVWYDPKTRQWRQPTGQVSIQTVQARR